MRLPLNLPTQAHNIERMVNDAAAGLHTMTHSWPARSSSDTCNQSTGDCYTSSSTETLPIILGTVIPLCCAIVLLIYLHRRHQSKLRVEDANDPHKSLDFGLDGVAPNVSRPKKAGLPEMSVTDKGNGLRPQKTRGLSMDMGLGSPYLLPSGLQGSRESLRSMSRSISDEHDPYRPVAMGLHTSDSDSIRSGRQRGEQGSLYSMSTGQHTTTDNAGLIANARPMSQSFGKRGDSRTPHDSPLSDDGPPLPSQIARKLPPRKQSLAASEKNLPLPPEPAAREMPSPRTTSAGTAPRLPRKDSQSTIHTVKSKHRSSVYEDDAAPSLPRPAMPATEALYDINPSMIFTGAEEAESQPPVLHAPQAMSAPRLSLMGGVGNTRLSVMGLRPVPSDLPDDNPEVRANRIRSFYKEYFDDSKPVPANAQYEEDYDASYLDAALYDPETGNFMATNGSRPFAQGPGRRAMTPPPRGPPRGSGQSHPHQRKYSTHSVGRPGPRGRQVPPKKIKLPPLKALTGLPTPHLLKEDVVVFNPIDFAPPSTFRQHQNGGRPDSPAGTSRPYSPSVRAFTPLASSFDHLAAMPSPHELRKSSTFTGLDFAPPSRIRDPGSLSPSDAGSIKSNRSGISAMQSDAIRSGAYRVSRIPKEMVSTRDDLANQLKPRMNLVERA